MDRSKKIAGDYAATLIEPGMIVGLGTGSTAAFFIKALSERKLDILAVASSEESASIAKKSGIKVIEINEAPRIDITVDGADEIDAKKRMIKGGGGALVREKILAASSTEMIVIVDRSKLSQTIGHVKLPIEIISFGSNGTKKRIEALGFMTTLRLKEDGSPFITDNHNLILDLTLHSPPDSPEDFHTKLLNIPGVVDTGFFFNLAGRVIIGDISGEIEILS
jgi:ribose 5-phosphate isomerase A